MYHAAYLKFCERARTEFLRTLGFQNSGLTDAHGIIIVVAEINAKYLKPARLDDHLDVVSTITQIKNASFTMNQCFFLNGQTIFSMDVALVCVNKTDGKPVPIPDNVKQAFLNYGVIPAKAGIQE